MRRTLAAAVAIAFLALYWLPCRTETDATPANHAHRLPTSPPPRTSGWPVAQQPIEAAAIADRRDERVSAPAAAAIAHPTSITLLLRGAPADQLHGTAMVRRKDGSTTATGFHDGRCEVHERSALDGVSLHVAGFAVAWPRLSGEAVTIEVPMRRAGAIRVRLIDTAGQPLAHRTITAMCQGAARATPHSVGYSASVRGITGSDGLALLEQVLPGTHDVFAARVAEWAPVARPQLVVQEGEVAACELVAAMPSPDRFGGFRLARADAPMLSGFANDVHSHVFASSEGHQYMLSFLGDEVRCAVQGNLGELVNGCIAPVDTTGSGQLLPPISVPITVTVGAFVDWQPAWIR